MASEISSRAPNGFLVFVGSVAMFVAVVGVFIGTIHATGSGGETLEQKRAAKRIETRERLELEAQERLHSTGWVDKAKGTVHIPIEEAMAAVIADLKSRKVAVSKIKVEPPLPMPVADPKSKEPAPPALPSAPQGANTIRFAYPYATPEASAAPAAPAAPVPAAAATAPVKSVAAPAKPAVAPSPVAAPVPKPALAPVPTASPAPAPAAPPAPTPPAPLPAAVAPPAPLVQPKPPAPATPPAPAVVTPPAPPARAPAAVPATPSPVAKPAPAAAPEAPARPPIINPTENSEPTK